MGKLLILSLIALKKKFFLTRKRTFLVYLRTYEGYYQKGVGGFPDNPGTDRLVGITPIIMCHERSLNLSSGHTDCSRVTKTVTH